MSVLTWFVAVEYAVLLAWWGWLKVRDHRMMAAVAYFFVQHPIVNTQPPTSLVGHGPMLLAPGVAPAKFADRFGINIADRVNDGPPAGSDETR